MIRTDTHRPVVMERDGDPRTEASFSADRRFSLGTLAALFLTSVLLWLGIGLFGALLWSVMP